VQVSDDANPPAIVSLHTSRLPVVVESCRTRSVCVSGWLLMGRSHIWSHTFGSTFVWDTGSPCCIFFLAERRNSPCQSNGLHCAAEHTQGGGCMWKNLSRGMSQLSVRVTCRGGSGEMLRG
jgi:hypothetical protein